MNIKWEWRWERWGPDSNIGTYRGVRFRLSVGGANRGGVRKSIVTFHSGARKDQTVRFEHFQGRRSTQQAVARAVRKMVDRDLAKEAEDGRQSENSVD
jgi:hypothetical protein